MTPGPQSGRGLWRCERRWWPAATSGDSQRLRRRRAWLLLLFGAGVLATGVSQALGPGYAGGVAEASGAAGSAEIVCGEHRALLAQRFAGHAELPMLSLVTKSGKLKQVLINPVTGSWSELLIARDAEGSHACLLDGGVGVVLSLPAPPRRGGSPRNEGKDEGA